MTIALGFACKQGILLATDSRTTFTDGFTLPRIKKLAVIRFSDGSQALLAKAGDVTFSNRYHETLEDQAATQKCLNERSAVMVAEGALKKTRSDFLEAFYHPTNEPGAGQTHLEKHHSKFVFGYCYEGKAHIYFLDSLGAIASPAKDEFIAIGSGNSVASVALSHVELADLTFGRSCGVAAYAIELCKRHDTGCGGDVQFMALGSDGKAFVPNDEDVGVYEIAANEMLNQHELSMSEQIHKMVVKEMVRRYV